jgi:hypothetical protein
MNCREFEDTINEMVHAKMIDAASRAAGLSHAEICERCAARLADERALTEGLKSLAASDEGKAAPASVEAALLEAFRAPAPNRIARHLSVQSGSWPRWTLTAAAAILIAFGFIVYRAIPNEPQKNNKVVKENPPAPQPSVNLEEKVVKENVEPEPRRGSLAPQSHHGNQLRHGRILIRDSINAYDNDGEYTTDFYPLSYSDDQKPMESGAVIRLQVIRVQMPRPALIAFGLPVNVERADVPVKADLLVGEDGLARAIRFIH